MRTLRALPLAMLLAAPLMADTTAQPVAQVVPPRVQIAILLDTSSSMDGLIDQARQQLWQAVSELGQARRNGQAPRLEVAVYEYGNTALSAESGYTRKVLGLDAELDKVSEALFALSTDGGDEYCGFAIGQAVRELQWSASPQDLKVLFIAGNEPFTQGPVDWKNAIEQARARGIVVNTIHAGDPQTGISEGWEQGATLAGGVYRSIDANQQIVHVAAPQDVEIARLNEQLNQTYVPYGAEGEASSARQQAQDKANESVSPALLAERATAKSSALYSNTQWDLVDAVKAGAAAPESMPVEELPPEMRELDAAARRDYVERKAGQRAELQERIRALGDEREKFVARSAEDAAASASTLGDSMVKALHEQGERVGLEFAAE